MKRNIFVAMLLAAIVLSACAAVTGTTKTEAKFNPVFTLDSKFEGNSVKLTTTDNGRVGDYAFKWCFNPNKRSWELEIVQYGGSGRSFIIPPPTCNGWNHLRKISGRKSFPSHPADWEDLDYDRFFCP